MKRLLPLLFLLAGALLVRGQEANAKPGVFYKVRSTEVAWVLYEPKTRTLQLQRREGPVQEYYNVPEDVFRQLMSNEFMGGFLKANLERKYPSKTARIDAKRA
jgi:KTSC domain